MKRMVGSVALFVGLSGAASAFDVPRYDPEAHCKQVANTAGGSAVIYAGCIDMEQDAYNELKRRWASVPPVTRSHCDDVGRAGGGSYSILNGCLDMESEAAANPKAFKF